MASALRDSLLHWRKKLERTNDETTILNVIHKLSKVPITVDLLQDTGIGKVIRNLAKKSGKVGKKASCVLSNWREIVASAQKLPETSPKQEHAKHSSSKRESSVSERILIEKSRKQSSSSHEKHKKVKHASDSNYKQNSFTNDSSRHLSPNKTAKDTSSNYMHKVNHAPSDYTDENEHKKNLACTTSNKLYHTDNDLDEAESDIEKSLVTKEFLSGKRKVTETQSSKFQNGMPDAKKCKNEFTPQSSSSHSSRSKNEVVKDATYNSDKKRDKEKKSHRSVDQSSTEHSVLQSQNHNHSNKNHEGERSHIKNKESKRKSQSKLKSTLKIEPTEAFTSSEVRFEDCLSFNDIVPVKRKKSSKSATERKEKHGSSKKESTSDASKFKVARNSLSKKHDKKSEIIQKMQSEVLQTPAPMLTEVDIISTLPQTQPNYRPLPQRNYDCSFPSKKKVLSNEEAIKFTSSRREKTSVYSGRKNLFFTEVPTLFDSCIRILIENIDAIEYMGGVVPYFILKQVLERCSASQLYNIEDYNPYLLEDTHELWEVHCKKDFRSHKPQENETWRDLYWRASEEREKKLKSITANISAHMTKSKPGRQVKLAYVDSVVKPPRDVARKQAKHGTALPVNHPVKAGPPSKATPRPIAPAINSSATSHSREFVPKKPKVAPLMAKTLKSMKQCFRR